MNEYEIVDNKSQYYSRVDHMRPCLDCWQHMTAPPEWTVPDLLPVLEHSDDDSADSVQHVDSDHVPDTDEDEWILPTYAHTTGTPNTVVEPATASQT